MEARGEMAVTPAWINKASTALALAEPEGLLRAQAQWDTLQDHAAYAAWDDRDIRTQKGESRRLEVDTIPGRDGLQDLAADTVLRRSAYPAAES